MTQNYTLDITALKNWQSFFTKKVHSKVLREYDTEKIDAVAIRMLGDIARVQLEEHLIPGGFAYELIDSVAHTTLEISILSKDKGLFNLVIQTELPIKIERKRTPVALGESIQAEFSRFQRLLDQQGSKVFNVYGEEVKMQDQGIKFFFGDKGSDAFNAYVNRKPQPKMNAVMMMEHLSVEVMQPYNDRGLRIVARFQTKELQELLEQNLKRFKLCNGVPIYLLASKTTRVYLAPTFCIVEQGDNLHLMYSIEKGSTVLDAAKVLQQLKVTCAEHIIKAMDLRR